MKIAVQEHQSTVPPSGAEITVQGDEFHMLNTIAGLGASAEMEDGRLSVYDETYQSVIGMMDARSTFLDANVDPRLAHTYMEFGFSELDLLAMITQRGALIHARANSVPLTQLTPAKNEGLAVARGIQVAQSIGWLSARDAQKNLDIYRKTPDSMALLHGPGPASDEALRHMREVSYMLSH